MGVLGDSETSGDLVDSEAGASRGLGTFLDFFDFDFFFVLTASSAPLEPSFSSSSCTDSFCICDDFAISAAYIDIHCEVCTHGLFTYTLLSSLTAVDG